MNPTPAPPTSERSPEPRPRTATETEPPSAREFALSLRVAVAVAIGCGLLWLGAWAGRRDPTPPPVGPFVESVPSTSAPAANSKPESLQPVRVKEPIALSAPKKVTVHVAGRVRKPGVYVLPPLSRVNDAIAKAGGVLPDGDPDALNLADFAQDGEKIEVPPKNAPQENEPIREPEPRRLASTPRRAPKPAAPARKPESAPKKTDTLASLRRPVNLNTADAEQLELLPGIGPSTAQKILDFRAENGRFVSVDDLDNVKGIGPKKLEKLRPYVTVR